MQIGANNIDSRRFYNSKLSDLSPTEYAAASAAMRNGEFWNPAWNDQDVTHGLTFPSLSQKTVEKSEVIPPELFNFDLILNGRTFKVMCDTLLRVNNTEDLAQFSDNQLKDALERCAAYRATCYMAYTAAHKEYRRLKQAFDFILVNYREEARRQIRGDRIADKQSGYRKEVGQITAQEIEDYVMLKYPDDYKKWQNMVADWEDNENVYLELRDTIKDRGMHLQTLLRMSNDHTDSSVSSGKQF